MTWLYNYCVACSVYISTRNCGIWAVWYWLGVKKLNDILHVWQASRIKNQAALIGPKLYCASAFSSVSAVYYLKTHIPKWCSSCLWIELEYFSEVKHCCLSSAFLKDNISGQADTSLHEKSPLGMVLLSAWTFLFVLNITYVDPVSKCNTEAFIWLVTDFSTRPIYCRPLLFLTEAFKEKAQTPIAVAMGDNIN